MKTQHSAPAGSVRTPDTRGQLLAAAEAVFAAQGEPARLDEIAAAAGLTKSTIFRHWPSKQDLVREVRLRGTERYRGWVEHACWATPDRPLAAVIDAAVGFFGRSRQALFDPLVTRDAIDDGAPELDVLADAIGDCVARTAPAQAADEVRTLLDSAVIATLRGWLGTPGLPGLQVDGDTLRTALETLVSGGLDGIADLPVTGRRPRRRARPRAGGGGAVRPREAQLLDAAIDGFAANGYDAATLEDIARRAGTTASAIFVYWRSKEELFLHVRAEITARMAERMLGALAGERTGAARLRAAIRSNLAIHYEHPEYQAILLPVASLPQAPELESVGWHRTIEQLEIVPGLGDVGDLLPVVVAIGLTVLRMAVLTMHEHAIHPALVTAVAEGYLVGGVSRLAAELGIPLDRPLAPPG